MLRFLRELFCNHHWEAQGDMLTIAYPPKFKCNKCDKIEGL